MPARQLSANVVPEKRDGRRPHTMPRGNVGYSADREGGREEKRQGTSVRNVLTGKRRIVLAVGGLLLGVGPWWLTSSWFAQLHVDDVRATIGAFGPIAPVVYVAVLAVSILLPPVPDAILVVAGGLSFGLVPATLYTLLGGVLGAGLNFGLARRLGRPWVRRRLGAGRSATVEALAARIGWPVVFLARLLPGFNFDLVSYAAGLTAMSLVAFETATLAGMVIPVIILAAAGDWAGERPEMATLTTAGSVASMAILPAVAWRFRRWWDTLANHASRRGPRVEVLPDSLAEAAPIGCRNHRTLCRRATVPPPGSSETARQ